MDEQLLANLYKYASIETQNTIDSLLHPKQVLSTEELLAHMVTKGIKFNIESLDDAREYLNNNTYFFKLAAYRANYTKRQRGTRTGQYEDLEFAYLKELAIIDMHLRYVILHMCLDIEHHIKVLLIKDIETNPLEDGYSIIDAFDSSKRIRSQFLSQAKSSYASDLIKKHEKLLDFPIWAFCELISFGELINLYKFYVQHTHGSQLPKYNLLYPIRNLRNASAHSNCLIYKLHSGKGSSVSDIGKVISSIPTIHKSAHTKYLKITPIHDFAVLLYWYTHYVKSPGLIRKRKHELYRLFFSRMTRHWEYFEQNEYIKNSYLFCIKLIIHFFGKY